jgi:hypothetical protein
LILLYLPLEIKEGKLMRLSKILTAAATLSLVTAPIAAQAKDNLPVRAATKADGEELVGISPIILVLVAAAVIGVIVLVATDDNKPASP